MKNKLLLLASAFLLTGCGGGVSLQEGQKYTFGNSVTISANEDVKTNFFYMIQEMKGYDRLDKGNKFYTVTDEISLGNYFVNEYKSLNITYHLNEPKDFFTFSWETSTYNMLGGLHADGIFCDYNGEGSYYENHPVSSSNESYSCSVTNHFLKLTPKDVSVEITAVIKSFDIISGTFSEKSRAVINVTVPVTK